MYSRLDEKTRIVQRRIVREVLEFFKQKKKALPLQILSAKYGRAVSELGGFSDFIEHMKEEGQLRIEYTDNGARSVWPVDVSEPKPILKPTCPECGGGLCPDGKCNNRKVWY